jgi:hypothetical protein
MQTLKALQMKNPFRRDPDIEMVSDKSIRRRNFLSFAGFIGFNAIAYGTWKWLYHSSVEKKGTTAGAREPLRNVLDKNELAFRKTFSNGHLVKTYPKSMAAKKVRVNSWIGMKGNDADPEKWMLTIYKKDGLPLNIPLGEIKSLPKSEIVFDFKCVEGWDQVSWWGGVKFSDFMTHFHLDDEAALQYVGLATPDKGYYVGLDMPSAMHPQTILAYEVNGKPLPVEHGQPLRLIIPVKYGIKNLKRIGSISFSDERPPDYWAERGYDYYSGL